MPKRVFRGSGEAGPRVEAEVSSLFALGMLFLLLELWVLFGPSGNVYELKRERERDAAKAAERAAEEATPEWREFAEACRLSHEYPDDKELWGDRLVAASKVLEAKKRARVRGAAEMGET
jgi:hypothetical protein